MNSTAPNDEIAPPPPVHVGGGFLSRVGRGVRAALLISVLTLVLTEVALRALGLGSPILYDDDEACGYRLRQDQEVRYFSNTITVNRWGVRDSRPFDTKNPALKRILVLGDSVTWGGIRLHQDELFTSILERTVPGTEVINAGVNGYSVGQMAKLYQSRLSELESDLVLVYAIPRDFVRPPVVTLNRDSAAFPKSTPALALCVALEGAEIELYRRTGCSLLKPSSITSSKTSDLTELEAVNTNVDALVNLKKGLSKSTRILVVLSPVLAGSSANGPVDKIKTALTQSGIPWVDLAERLKAGPAMFVDGVHFSVEGHARAGEALATLLQESSDASPLDK
ncbi:MAG: SGNH/GDSL hydrolase family protein [Candidatus Hydrogenedentales bacterium]|jgi:hypothetical protein